MPKRRERRHMNTTPPKPTGKRRLATVEETLGYARIKRNTFYNLLNAGAFKAYKLSNRTMVDLDTVDNYLNALPEYSKC